MKKLDNAFNITPEVEVDSIEVKEPVGIQNLRLLKMILQEIMNIQEAIYTLSLKRDKKPLMEFLNLLKRVKCQEHMK